MSWINEHKKVWRVAVLMGLVVAAMGPWIFDLISVPAEYPCSAPYVRVYDDFCGEPLPGALILLAAGRELLYIGWRRALALPIGLFLSLFVLPSFITLLLILCRDRRSRQVSSIFAWGLAAGIGLTVEVSTYPKLFRAWGLWLFIGVAVSALTLEVLTLAARRRPNRGSGKERAS
jgi:hypothetical protein